MTCYDKNLSWFDNVLYWNKTRSQNKFSLILVYPEALKEYIFLCNIITDDARKCHVPLISVTKTTDKKDWLSWFNYKNTKATISFVAFFVDFFIDNKSYNLII